MSRRAVAVAISLAVATGLLSSGCGGRADDLFAVTRAGTVPGARLELIVADDGTAYCNGRHVRLTDQQLLDARQLQRDLQSPARSRTRLARGPMPVFTYSVRTPAGSVSFADDSRPQPAVFFAVAEFVHRVAQASCALAR